MQDSIKIGRGFCSKSSVDSWDTNPGGENTIQRIDKPNHLYEDKIT